jgi:hypothetical protein
MKNEMWLVTLECSVGGTSFKSHRLVKGDKPDMEEMAQTFYDDEGGEKSVDGWVFSLNNMTCVAVKALRCVSVHPDDVVVLKHFGVV